MFPVSRIFSVVLMVLTLACISSVSYAEAEKADKAKVEVKLNADFGIGDTLKTFKGTKRRVSLLLNNGISYTGVVAEVGTRFVVLSQLGGGKDFYDALIQLEEITALEVQVR